MRTNKNAKLLKLGDRVTTDYYSGQNEIVRNITDIHEDSNCGSGVRASVDGGEPCKECRRIPGFPVVGIDGGWFIPKT